MNTTNKKETHYLDGIFHEGSLDGKRVVTTWTTKKSVAEKLAEAFRVEGALLSRIFSDDGRRGHFRVVGYFETAAE